MEGYLSNTEITRAKKTKSPLMIIESTRYSKEINCNAHNSVAVSRNVELIIADSVLIYNDGTRVRLDPKKKNNDEIYLDSDWDFEYNSLKIGQRVVGVFILYPKF